MARRGGQDRGLFERPVGSGVWWIHYHDADGRRHREKVGPKALARKRYMQRKTETAEGRYFPNVRRRAVTFDDLLDDYREAKRREDKEIIRGEVGFRRLLESFGGRSADSIGAAEVERWRDSLRETLSPATVNRHLTLLRAILSRGLRDGRIGSTPMTKVGWLKESNGRIRYLIDDEETRLMDALPGWLKPLVMTAIHTGLRKSELLGLRWDDVDFHAGAITVREAKSGEVERVPINQTVRRGLLALRDERMRRAKLTGDARALFGRYVFCAPGGGRMMNLNRYWYPALKGAGIEDFHFHDLRHSFCSRLVMAGVDLYRVQKLARHRSPSMTMRYAHLTPGALRQAVEVLDTPIETPRTVTSSPALREP